MHGNKGCLQPCKKKGQLILKTPGGWIIKVQMQKKSFLWKRLILDLIFTRFRTFCLVFLSSDIFSSGLFYCNLISWDFIGCPQTMLGRKVPGIKITGLYFQWNFFSKNLRKFELFSKVFISSFFPKSISRDFLT